MQKTSISIIVPCYNQAQYLDECLQSVLDQTYLDWECIIVNDGSPDNTEDAAAKWIKKDPRFKYVYRENGGLSSARNTGIETAEGKWILPLDADDKIGNRYLELAEREFDKGYTVIYCNAEYFGSSSGPWRLKKFVMTDFAIQNLIFCSAFFKKEVWASVGGYDENLMIGYEDWDFWIRIISNENLVYKLNDTCFYYRIKEISMTTELHEQGKNMNKILFYLYNKNCDFFSTHLPNIQKTLIEDSHTQKKLAYLDSQYNKVITSKRFKLGSYIVAFLDKVKFQK